MLNEYKLDLGYHTIGGGVLSNVNSVLLELDDHVDIFESYVGLINEDRYNFPFLSRFDKLKIAPKILRLLSASEKTLKQLDSVSIAETIKKYGKENFIKEIIEECDNTQKLNEREIFWIKELKACEDGYNLDTGGIGGKHSNETIQKMKKMAVLRDGFFYNDSDR